MPSRRDTCAASCGVSHSRVPYRHSRLTDQRSPALNRTGQSSKLRLTRRGSTSGAAQSWASGRELRDDSKPRLTRLGEACDRRATRSEERRSRHACRSRGSSKFETRTRATHRPEAEDAPPCHVNAKNSRSTSSSECCRRAVATAEMVLDAEVPKTLRACARRPTDQHSAAPTRTRQSSKLRLTWRGLASAAVQS